MFPIHSQGIHEKQPYGEKPGQKQCTDFNFRAFRWMEAMVFFIEEINRNQTLLPNITLGYSLYDICSLESQAIKATLSMMTKTTNKTGRDCAGLPSVPVVIGNSGSSLTIAVSRALQPFRVPLVSYFATCACLSNKHKFPNVFRTIPSDVYQARALAHLVHHFGWNWVGTIGSDDDYGYNGIQMFIDEVTTLGACIAYRLLIPKELDEESKLEIVKTINESTAKAIVVFSIEAEIYHLIKDVALHNITDKQWIASEAWVTSTLISSNKNFSFLEGTIGFAVQGAKMPELKDFLLACNTPEKPYETFGGEFLKMQFECVCNKTDNMTNKTEIPCRRYPKTQEGGGIKQDMFRMYSDVSQLRVTYNVQKAVYAIAHALHNLQSCKNGKGPFTNKTCGNIYNLQPWQVAHYLKEINFTNRFGDQVNFDVNGDPLGSYDIVNWQTNSDASIQYVTIGRFDPSLPKHEQLTFNEDEIIWSGGKREVPKSVCTESCPAGYRKATRVGQPVCCYDCVFCADGTITNMTDQAECIQCPVDFWSSENRTSCVVKDTEYLSYSEAFGIALATISILGVFLTMAVAAIFLKHKDTPIVRANNSELSFLLLFSLGCCFLCALTFIGHPTGWTCCLRHTSFGISFALCLSCVLSKTAVVLMAFRATLPGNNIAKWFGPVQQRLSVFACASAQIIVCLVWLAVSPPVEVKNTWLYKDRIIVECDMGSVTLFCFVLGYIGCLACCCFLLAFMARKLPDNFNEAKLITFSMLIFCAVWITFIPAYMSSPGKYTVAVEIFAILSSTFGVLLCIFVPKCYIIIFLPKRNSKKYLIPQTKSGK
ncbi:extracellular calcium-sensing receptor-like [Amia ocellicauda]|uniref:extracellular calcium-sensing receptor-like n=1 Tax=Amia ocellicauda TaxID=2972642 RepID=UPI003464220A